MNKLNYEILSAIDNIETTVMESEINVMNSLINSYDKAVMILENCNDNTNVDAFDIFQESVIMEAADDNNGNKKKKSIKEKILDFIELISRMIKKAWNFLKRKIDRIRKNNKPVVDEKLVEEIKDIVDDNDTVSVEIIPPTNGSSKPQVTVSTASHDTEKEEQIKSKVESVISSTPSQAPHSYIKSNPSVSSGNVGTTALTNIEISKGNVKVTYTYNDVSDCIRNLSTACKKFDELVESIDVDRLFGKEYYREFYEKSEKVEEYFRSYVETHHIEFKKCDLEFLNKYKTEMLSILEDSLNTIKHCGDTLEKYVAEFKRRNKFNGLPEDKIENIGAYSIFDIIRRRTDLTIKWLNEHIDTLNSDEYYWVNL